MSLPQKIFLGLSFLFITAIFFRPVITKGYLPFPGDLLLAEYQPWRSYSFNGIYPGAVPNKAQYFDTLRQMYPWKTVVINEIKKIRLPLWNPFNFAGAPLLANFQSAVFYPLNIIYLLFSGPIAWSIMVILQPLLCMIFTYLYCRSLKLSVPAALLSSIAYGWCLFMTVFLEYNTLGHYLFLLPLSLYSIEKLLSQRSLWAELLFLTAIVSAGFAGHLQLFFGLIVYVLGYILIRVYFNTRNFKETLKQIFPFYFLVFLAILIAGIQLFPTYELISLSARSAHPYQFLINHFLITPSQLIMYLVPDLFGNPATRNYLLDFSYPTKAIYIGQAPIFLAILSLFLSRKQPLVKIFLTLTLGVALFTISNPVGNLFYRLNLPFISSSSPSNLVFLLSFSLSMLAGFGFEELGRAKNSPWHLVVGLFWLLLAGTFIISKVSHLPISTNNLLYSAIILTMLTIGLLIINRFGQYKKYLIYALIVLTVIDLAYFFGKFNPFVPISFFYPETSIGTWLQKHTGIDRFWGYGSAAISANLETQLGVNSPNGYDPLYPSSYGKFIQTSNNGVIPSAFTDQSRSDATVVPGYGETDMADNKSRLKVLQLLGVRYILDKVENGSTQKTFPPELFTQLAQFDGWIIYEYQQAAPRVFLTSQYQVFKNDQDFTEIFFSPNFDASKQILLEDKPDLYLNKATSGGQIKINKYLPDYISLETKSPENQLLFLSDTYYPGWRAYVDHVEQKILRADYSFRAIEVSSGNHLVEFKYQPKSFYFGLISTIIGSGIWLLAILSRWFKKWIH